MILGLSCYYHDSAAVLLGDDGAVVAAAQEERFTRVKHTAAFPNEAIRWCVQQAQSRLSELEAVVFYENPALKYQRVMDTFLSVPQTDPTVLVDVVPAWVDHKAFQVRDLGVELERIDESFDARRRLLCVPHHAAHAASAFFPSPWREALVITVDGVGEYATTTVSVGRGNVLQVLKEIHYPHSLGLFYSALTYFCGFKVNSGEYKLMGLAPYGVPRFAGAIRERLLKTHEDGSFRIDPQFFGAFAQDRMVAPLLDTVLGGPPLPQGQAPTQREADIAASVQVALEDALVNLVSSQMRATGIDRVCLAGGVALNCVANARLLRELPLKGLWVQPAAGDAGGALGAAMFEHFAVRRRPRRADGTHDAMSGALLGPGYSDAEIQADLDGIGAVYERLGTGALVDTCARLLAEGRTVAWFQGAMEFGPRALGSRSILADPRLPNVQRDLNLKIKKRESFRPFAPAVLSESASDWFGLTAESPYMLLTAPVHEARRTPGYSVPTEGGLRASREHSDIPAVTHVDGSARVQTVTAAENPMFHALLARFAELTTCPVLVNTSFNTRGEPIVCTGGDAFRCFMNTELDYLAAGSFIVERQAQDPLVEMRCRQTFEPD